MGIFEDKVNRLIDIGKKIAELNLQKAELEAFFLKEAEDKLADTKYKTASFSGTSGRVNVVNAKSLKLTYPSMLKNILGAAYSDVVKEEVKYKISKPATRMLTGLWSKEFIRMTKAEVIDKIDCDDKTRALLHKKLKGINYDNDKNNLMTIAGLEESAAEELAWFVSEAAVWESFTQLLKLDGEAVEHKINMVLQSIDSAMIVEESLKVSIDQI